VFAHIIVLRSPFANEWIFVINEISNDAEKFLQNGNLI
jgi:hypothetical protein